MRLLLTALSLVAATSVFAVEPAEQFSADQVMTVQGTVITSQVYVDSGNMRSEMSVEGSPEMISIVNAEKGVVWLLMPGDMYVENTIAQDDDASRKAWTDSSSREFLGTEEVDGQICDKYRIKGGQALYFYANTETGLPVLMASADGKVRVEWRNVRKGPQPARLFDLPAGYKKLALPSLFKLPGLK